MTWIRSAKMTYVTTIAADHICAATTNVSWREEYLRDVSALQRVYLSKLFIILRFYWGLITLIPLSLIVIMQTETTFLTSPHN